MCSVVLLLLDAFFVSFWVHRMRWSLCMRFVHISFLLTICVHQIFPSKVNYLQHPIETERERALVWKESAVIPADTYILYYSFEVAVSFVIFEENVCSFSNKKIQDYNRNHFIPDTHTQTHEHTLNSWLIFNEFGIVFLNKYTDADKVTQTQTHEHPSFYHNTQNIIVVSMWFWLLSRMPHIDLKYTPIWDILWVACCCFFFSPLHRFSFVSVWSCTENVVYWDVCCTNVMCSSFEFRTTSEKQDKHRIRSRNLM